MEKKELNLGSTFNEFLNALNTNTEDTEGIIEGTKKVKKLSLGEENETQDLNSISTEKNDDGTWSLLLESEHDIELNVGDQSGISIVDRDIHIFVPEEDASIISIIGGDIDIQGHWSDGSAGRVSIKGGNSSSLDIGTNGGKDIASLSANDEIRITATNDSENGKLILKGDEISIEGNVDFTNANVVGLPSGGLNISPATIEYDSENNQLNISNSDGSINIYANDSIYFTAEAGDIAFESTLYLPNGAIFGENGTSTFNGNTQFNGNVDFTNANITGLPTSDVNTQDDITWEGDQKFTGNVQFYGEVDFTNAIISSNNLFVLDNDNTIHGETDYQAPVIFNSDVDFSNANVIGLSSGGGGGSSPLALQVNELPTENIDNSKVYIVAENAQVYIKAYLNVITLENFLQGSGVTNPVLNYHVVPTLPTEGEVTDFVTMTPMHCYINSSNGIAYFYGNLGAGNMWVNAGALFAQVTGSGAEDAGRTYSISDELEELNIRIYTYWEDVQYVYTINNQWCKVNYSNGFNPDNDYTFTGRNSFEGSTHLKNSVTIGNSDAGNIGIVNFFTEQVTFHHGKVTFNNGHESDIDGGVEFYGKVDFTNADVTGLLNFNSSNTFDEEIIILNPNGEAGGSIKYNPIGNNPTVWLPDETGTLATQEWVNSQGSSSGLTQEEVQEMINTAINGALEGSY